MKKLLLISFALLLFISCSEKEKFELAKRDHFSELNESEFFEIKLNGKISNRESELSGLAWYKNNLILLPQFPYKFGDGLHGTIYYLPKEKLKRAVNSRSQLPLTPLELKIDATGLDKFNWWGSGYEGIAFIEDEVYLVIENYKEKTEGFIVKGVVDFGNKIIKLNPNTLTKIQIPSFLQNMAEETITQFNEEIYVIAEINGGVLNFDPIAVKFSRDLKTQQKLNFPKIEYRITDATDVESDNTFWVINYLWLGDVNKLRPQNDGFMKMYGVGKSHKENYSIERLIKLQITPAGIELADQPPVYIKLAEDWSSRNWEGLVKLDDMGFLIVTDKFPKTILGFIPQTE